MNNYRLQEKLKVCANCQHARVAVANTEICTLNGGNTFVESQAICDSWEEFTHMTEYTFSLKRRK